MGFRPRATCFWPRIWVENHINEKNLSPFCSCVYRPLPLRFIYFQCKRFHALPVGFFPLRRFRCPAGSGTTGERLSATIELLDFRFRFFFFFLPLLPTFFSIHGQSANTSGHGAFYPANRCEILAAFRLPWLHGGQAWLTVVLLRYFVCGLPRYTAAIFILKFPDGSPGECSKVKPKEYSRLSTSEFNSDTRCPLSLAEESHG